jgi:hypothetical protein
MTPVPSGRGTSELLRVQVPLGSAGTVQELPGTRPPVRVVPRPGKQRLTRAHRLSEENNKDYQLSVPDDTIRIVRG